MGVSRFDVSSRFTSATDPASVGVQMTPDEAILIGQVVMEAERARRKDEALKAILEEIDFLIDFHAHVTFKDGVCVAWGN